MSSASDDDMYVCGSARSQVTSRFVAGCVRARVSLCAARQTSQISISRFWFQAHITRTAQNDRSPAARDHSDGRTDSDTIQTYLILTAPATLTRYQ